MFLVIWIIGNRSIQPGFIASHVGHGIAFAGAWHNWAFTWLIGVGWFAIGFMAGLVISAVRQHATRRSFSPDDAIEAASSVPTHPISSLDA